MAEWTASWENLGFPKLREAGLQSIEIVGRKLLVEAGVEEEEAALEVRLLLQESFSLDTANYLLKKRDPLFELFGENKGLLERFQGFFENFEKRRRRIPLAQILGRQSFYGLDFYVNENVLIPRADTECLVDLVLEDYADFFKKENRAESYSEVQSYAEVQSHTEVQSHAEVQSHTEVQPYSKVQAQALKILDLCTGSGCIGISVAKHLPYEELLLVDLSEKALVIAKKNAEKHLRGNVALLQSDLLKELPRYLEETKSKGEGLPEEAGSKEEFSERKFSLLLSNPPYIVRDLIPTLEKEVSEYEPKMALDGGEDGLLFYRRIAKEAKDVLLPGARLYLEIGYDQGESVKDIFQKEGYDEVEVFQDLSGNPRVLRGIFSGK